MPDLDPVPPALRDAILAWYAAFGRTLPFRGTTDPYAILVSEAMAQQTQAARAGEAWLGFMDRFPTAGALAAATPADVLRAWQGLGYNRRALNLWRAACQIVELHGGEVPADLRALEALPGVGPYTARAVAALAFAMPVGAVDTNVRRVLGRIVAGGGSGLGAAALQVVADAAVPPGRPAAWTHALMDLGATVCRPQRPDCPSCPARAWCRYAADNTAGDDAVRTRPVARAAGSSPTAIRGSRQPFASTSRWLRGRIVDQLRAADTGRWTLVAGPMGGHDDAAIDAALDALAREGLLELESPVSSAVGRRARLPIA